MSENRKGLSIVVWDISGRPLSKSIVDKLTKDAERTVKSQKTLAIQVVEE